MNVPGEDDDLDRYARQLRRRRVIVLAVSVAIGAVLLGLLYFKFAKKNADSAAEDLRADINRAVRLHLEPEARQALARAIATRKQAADTARRTLATMTLATLAASAPGEGVCPAAGLAEMDSTTWPGKPGSPEASAALDCEACDDLGALAGKPAAALDLDDQEAVERMGGLGRLILVVDERISPTVSPGVGGGFEAGAVLGRAYVFDPVLGQVLCAGRFEARSSDSLEFNYTRYGLGSDDAFARAIDAADRDLAHNARIAAMKGMRAVK
jgi:hypothetical protein